MKKKIVSLLCLFALILPTVTVFAAKTELYALDGRTIFVEEKDVEAYTAEGMGWFLEKPVTMYAADGRTLVVPSDQVEAYKAVGWYLEGEVPEVTEPTEKDETTDTDDVEKKDALENDPTALEPSKPDGNDPTALEPSKPGINLEENGLATIKYTDGTIVKVPSEYVATYKLLGWEVVSSSNNNSGEAVNVNKVTMYFHDGNEIQVPETEVKTYQAKGYGLSYDEAVYNFAVFGISEKELGSVELLKNKSFESAFGRVEAALKKLEQSNSEYVQLLYTMRSEVTRGWEAAAKSPLGFINYWFDIRTQGRIVVFEYRNLTDKRITYIGINFDICDKDGNVIETNDGTYYVNNLQVLPYDKARIGWIIKSGDEACTVKNVKVKEVRFADGTKWIAE